MRLSQLTTANIARAFRLMPETIILVSDRDTVAIPQDGIFHDVDNSYTWTVEGEKSTTNMSMGLHHGSKLGKGTERWKSQSFPPSRAVLAQHAQGHSYGKHVSEIAILMCTTKNKYIQGLKYYTVLGF